MNNGETVGEIMITEEEIRKRAGEIGEQIGGYAGESVLLVGILKALCRGWSIS